MIVVTDGMITEGFDERGNMLGAHKSVFELLETAEVVSHPRINPWASDDTCLITDTPRTGVLFRSHQIYELTICFALA